MSSTEAGKALVVGGSSGIGLASAADLLKRGFQVHVVGRNADRLSGAERTVGGIVTHQADAGSAAEIRAVASAIGPIDVLVITVSGSEGMGPIADLDLAMLRRVFDDKFWAHLTTLQGALPHLTETASITLVGAITARTAMAGTAGIGAVNAAVEALVKPLAVELAPRRVNAVSPGFVDTPWWSGMPASDKNAYFEQSAKILPVGKIGTPEEVAEAILLLATNKNITGTVIETDGGARLVTL